MITVEKGNVVLNIMDEEKDKYLSKGFNVVDNKGNVVEEGELVDLGEVRRAYTSLKDEYEKVLADNKKLKSEIKKLKKK